MTLSGLQPLPERLEDGAILVLPGVGDSQRYFAGEEAEQARRWLATLRPDLQRQRITLVCICSGALLAAQAGLLDGYQCTTHHDVIERIRRQAPAAGEREPYLRRRSRRLHQRGHHHRHRFGAAPGPSPLRLRPGARRRPRYGGLFPPRRGRSAAVALAALPQPPAPGGAPRAGRDGRRAGGRLVGAAGGGKAHVSSRHLARLFRSHVGISVREYHEQLRLAVAQQRLQQGYGLEKAALAAGFLPGDSCAAPSSASARRYDTSRRVSSRCRPTDSSRLSPSATPNTQKISSSGWPVKSRCRLRITLTIRA